MSYFLLEDKQAWKIGLMTSQLSPPLAHRNVESKETEHFCSKRFKKPDFNKNPLGEGKQP